MQNLDLSGLSFDDLKAQTLEHHEKMTCLYQKALLLQDMMARQIFISKGVVRNSRKNRKSEKNARQLEAEVKNLAAELNISDLDTCQFGAQVVRPELKQQLDVILAKLQGFVAMATECKSGLDNLDHLVVAMIKEATAPAHGGGLFFAPPRDEVVSDATFAVSESSVVAVSNPNLSDGDRLASIIVVATNIVVAPNIAHAMN